MDKLVITQEQERSFLDFKSTNKDCKTEEMLELFNDNHKHWESQSRKGIASFTPQQFALLLCGWYEVEEEYTIGDWVIYLHSNQIFMVKGIGIDGSIMTDDPTNGKYTHSSHYRKATPEEIAQEKERRFWAELGREVDGYKVGDVVSKSGNIQEISGTLRDGWKIQTYSSPVYNDELTLICPVERRMDT